jgi:hypothetical protein
LHSVTGVIECRLAGAKRRTAIPWEREQPSPSHQLGTACRAKMANGVE